VKGLLRRLRGALGMGAFWAVGGAILGGVFEVFVDPTGRIVDLWIPALALPAFLSGVVFSGVLAIAGRKRHFRELSLRRFAAWGAVGGAIVGVAGVAVLGIANVAGIASVLGLTAVGSSLAATGTLALARFASDPAAVEADDSLDDVGLSERERRELLGG